MVSALIRPVHSNCAGRGGKPGLCAAQGMSQQYWEMSMTDDPILSSWYVLLVSYSVLLYSEFLCAFVIKQRGPNFSGLDCDPLDN